MQAPHQWLSDFIKDTCVTMILKLFCHWTAAMLQCLILRVVLWHCIFVLCCVVALLPDQEVALLLLLHSVPVLRTLYIVQCASTYIAHCYRTSYTATTQPSLHCSCFTAPRLCPLTKVSKHRAQCRKVLDLGQSVAGGDVGKG